MISHSVLEEDIIKRAVLTLRGSYAALPSEAEMKRLVTDSITAEKRGYYDPIEDERLREAYSRYLAMRVGIWQMIQSLKPRFKRLSLGQADLKFRDYQSLWHRVLRGRNYCAYGGAFNWPCA